VTQFQERLIADKTEPILKELENGKSTLARLAAVVLKHRGKSRSEISHVVESAAREEILHLHAGIAVLDTIITIAPLLGLLGTASGLVRIFQGLGDNSDHLAIARGIAEALTTTIFGLAIAVPCVIAHGYFIRHIEKLTGRLESLLTGLSAVCEKPNSNA
jgi:biopolymer transport protein ExbB